MVHQELFAESQGGIQSHEDNRAYQPSGLLVKLSVCFTFEEFAKIEKEELHWEENYSAMQ